MKYQRIVSYVASQLWAIEPSKLGEMLAVLAYRAAGEEFTPEEIQARIGAATPAGQHTRGGGVAVIPIRGTMAHRMGGLEESSGGTSAELIGKMLARVSADDSIGTIVYDIDSPGGTVTGMSELAAQMFALRGQKRQIAQVNGLAASAAYWLASQADEIVSIPSGRAGSIGVFTAHEDLSKALEQKGINVTLISAGKYKTENNPLGPLSDEGRARLQASVDEAYANFAGDVARGRGVSLSAVTSGYGEGRTLVAAEAKAAGLIDRIGSLEETVASAIGPARTSVGLRASDQARRLELA